MLINPCVPSLNFRYGSLSTGPNNNGVGTQITPAAGSYGSYTSVISSGNITQDCYGIFINFNTMGAFSSLPSLATIGIDTAGGTSFTDIIKDLSAAQSANPLVDSCGGHSYYFPIFIPAGSSIGVKTCIKSGGNTTTGRVYAAIAVFGGAQSPEGIKYGQTVKSWGATLSTAMGVTVTLANNTTGSWVEIGTVGSDEYPFFWDASVCVDSSNLPASSFSVDLAIGDASNKTIVVQGKSVGSQSSEALSSINRSMMGAYYQASPGDKIYARTNGPNTGSWTGTFSIVANGVM